MAKKKKKAPGKRRMGAAGKGGKNNLLMTGVGVVLGIAGAALLDKKVLGSSASTTMKGGGELVVGGLAAWKIRKSPLITGLSLGVAGYGGLRLIDGLTGAGISGLGCIDQKMVSGFRDVPAIAGTQEQMQARIRRFPTPSQIGSPRTRRAAMLAQG